MMKEIGGYIELEKFHGVMLHENAIPLNCGRNALAYLCKAKKIEKLYIPYFLCSSVPELCEKVGALYEYYHINENFDPLFQKELGKDEWLYVVNFYGQLSNTYIDVLRKKYNNVIIDNAQSYYQMPVEGIDTLYTCRKFFGVADGAFLYTNQLVDDDLSVDESFERMHFLLGRYERTANEFYSEYAANNKRFASEPIKKMSKLTMNLLHGIDYKFVEERRSKNFEYLADELNGINKFHLINPKGAFMYPLWIDGGAEIRKILQKEKIYIPTLWPNVLENCSEDMLEYHLAANVLPLPVDQRYSTDDMGYLVERVKNVLSQRA